MKSCKAQFSNKNVGSGVRLPEFNSGLKIY